MKIVCREVDKYSNRRTLYYIVPVKFRAGLMRDLYLRELLNPELKYFITKLDEKIPEEEMLKIFKNKKYRKNHILYQLLKHLNRLFIRCVVNELNKIKIDNDLRKGVYYENC